MSTNCTHETDDEKFWTEWHRQARHAATGLLWIGAILAWGVALLSFLSLAVVVLPAPAYAQTAAEVGATQHWGSTVDVTYKGVRTRGNDVKILLLFHNVSDKGEIVSSLVQFQALSEEGDKGEDLMTESNCDAEIPPHGAFKCTLVYSFPTAPQAVTLTVGYLEKIYFEIAMPRAASASAGDKVVAEYKGSGNVTTRPFTVTGAWKVQWESRGTFFAIDGRNGDAAATFPIFNTGDEGGSPGSYYEKYPGTYTLEVQSIGGPWHVRVIALNASASAAGGQ